MGKKINKIIIVTVVIIIIFVLSVVSVVVFLENRNKNNEDKLLENSITKDKIQEENDKILQNDNITIIENSNETLNRKYGKVEIVWIVE